jgi:phage protein D
MSQDITALQQSHGNFFTPAFKILVDGKDLLTNYYMEIASVQVDNTLKGADRFSFTVNSTFNFENREFQHLKDTFELGKPVEIYMGYTGNQSLTLMLRGMITAVQTSFPSSGLPQINVSGYDLSYPMTLGKQSENWSDRTDTEVVKLIAAKHGLDVKADDTKVKHPKTEQSQESYLQFLEKLAERNGFEVYVYDKTLYFRPPQNGVPAGITLEWGKGLVSFAPEINISEQVTKVEVRGWDVQKKAEFLGVAQRGDEPGRDPGRKSGAEYLRSLTKNDEAATLKVRLPVFSKQEAEQRAKAILKKRSETFVQGSGESIGIPELMADSNIELKGLGALFSKTYYVDQTTHTISTSGFKTTFKIKETTV